MDPMDLSTLPDAWRFLATKRGLDFAYANQIPPLNESTDIPAEAYVWFDYVVPTGWLVPLTQASTRMMYSSLLNLLLQHTGLQKRHLRLTAPLRQALFTPEFLLWLKKRERPVFRTDAARLPLAFCAYPEMKGSVDWSDLGVGIDHLLHTRRQGFLADEESFFYEVYLAYSWMWAFGSHDLPQIEGRNGLLLMLSVLTSFSHQRAQLRFAHPAAFTSQHDDIFRYFGLVFHLATCPLDGLVESI
jgi:hypothetical protein